MKPNDLKGRNSKNGASKPALLVLGMHRSGTSAITGSLGFSGAWVGGATELTSPNAENPQGFWERRDVREVCDQMLHAAGADWWKIAEFDPQAIPRATLAAQRRKFKKIVSSLDEYQAWIVKEPRLCLLLPVLQDYIHNPVCIHIYRNPLEVAQSLQRRDGFSIAAGLALWEAYNLHALDASKDLRRVLIDHQSLISNPAATLNALVEQLEEFDLDHPITPDTRRIERFIDAKLYHQKATDEETQDYLLPSQQALWARLRSGEVLDHDGDTSISQATTQQLLDLESTQLLISRHQDESQRLVIDLRANTKNLTELNAGMKSRAATIEARNKDIAELNARMKDRAATILANDRAIAELNAGMKSRATTIEARNKDIAELNARMKDRAATILANDRAIAELNAGMKSRAATIEARNKDIAELNARMKDRAATILANDRAIAELNAGMKSRAATIEARNKDIAELNARMKDRAATILARNKEIGELNGRMKDRAATIEARDKTISDLLNSTSWKVTRPLRAISQSVRWLATKLRGAFDGAPGRDRDDVARIIDPARVAAGNSALATKALDDDQSLTGTDRLAKLISARAEARQSGRTQGTAGEKRAGGQPKTKITVVAWDLGHNPLGRTYLLADVLRNDYDVELVGANFPRFGSDIWKPLRNCSRVTIKSFPGANFPEHFNHMEDIARQIEGDVIYVSKPRLPSIELAILAKLQRNRPVILDVDDHELGFFKNHQPLTLDEAKAQRNKQDFKCPHDEIWTRYSESLIPLFDQVTVSGEELQKKFAGQVLPHIRDEFDFDPTAYPRDLLRAELGFTPRDKVVLFVGTPRMHKGVAQILAALKKLNRPDYKLVVVGTPVDWEARRFLAKCSPGDVTVVADTPFCDLPGYLCIGDLICLIQAEDKEISLYQTPAKFTDGLSMGIPMLASNVPPLVTLANKALVELLDDSPLERKIDEIFSNYETYKRKAMRNRKVFLREYSYAAHLPRLKKSIESLLGNPAPVPDAFVELIACHRGMFSNSARLPRVTAKIVVDRRGNTAPAADNVRPTSSRSPRATLAAKADNELDIVFFWKQNDTGIYGRRQDMLVKYLAKDPRIHRIFHFDAPLNLLQSGQAAVKSGQAGRYSHARLVLFQTLARKLRLQDTNKVRFDTFIHAGTKRRVPGLMKRIVPCEKDYLEYLDRTMKRHNIGQRRTVFWVCPNNFDFPSIADRFQPDLVVADVIDDQRQWPVKPNYREKLHANYQDVLARSDLTFTNCRSVFESMQEFTGNIHLISNAAEILEDEARHWPKPAELRSMQGPVIGYVGNLDIARIDLDLLAVTAAQRPDWNLVFIGSMHQNKDLLDLNKFKNVHFLGVRPYEKAIRYIRHFDVAIVPHLDNQLTRHMNPLKLYVYFSLHVPVVITPIANAGEFEEFIEIGRTAEEFIERISHCLDNDTISGNLDSIRSLLNANSWDERVSRMLLLIGAQFAGQ